MKRGRAKRGRTPSSEPDLIRFGISIPNDLLKKFDLHLAERNNQNRSEAIRDLIRDKLLQDAWNEGKGEQVAVVTLVFNSQNLEIQKRLSENKRALGERLLSSLQLRLSPEQDMDIFTIRGPASQIRNEAETVIGLKGVLHGKFVLTSAGNV